MRLSSNTRVDIARFERDWHNSNYYFLLNADETIYLRYGGRDEHSAERYFDLDSFTLALKLGLREHYKYVKKTVNQKVQAEEQGIYPQDISLLKQNVIQAQRCVECHLIADYSLQEKTLAGLLDPISDFYRSPDINALGIELDIPKGLVVANATGAAKQAGIQTKDVIKTIEGKAVLTFGDFQFQLDKVNRHSKYLSIEVLRNEKLLNLRLTLNKEWWKTDLEFRHWSNQPRVYFKSKPLSPKEKKEYGLEEKGFAAKVEKVDIEAVFNENHSLKVGDIITAVNGTTFNMFTDDIETHIILSHSGLKEVNLSVIRNGQSLKLKLCPGYENYRKVTNGKNIESLMLNWTDPLEVMHDGNVVVIYRMTLVNKFIVVQVKHAPSYYSAALSTVVLNKEATYISGSFGEATNWLHSEPLKVKIDGAESATKNDAYTGMVYFAHELPDESNKGLISIVIHPRIFSLKLNTSQQSKKPLRMSMPQKFKMQKNASVDKILRNLVPIVE